MRIGRTAQRDGIDLVEVPRGERGKSWSINLQTMDRSDYLRS